MKKPIQRPGDLAPRGIKSTITGEYSNSEKFEQLCKLKKELTTKLHS
jgi:hypothetical protein